MKFAGNFKNMIVILEYVVHDYGCSFFNPVIRSYVNVGLITTSMTH